RERNGLLGDEVDTAVGDLLQDARSLVGLEHRAENLPSFAMARQLAEKGRCDHHFVEPIDNLVARAWPSHHVATLGSARSLPSTVGASAGRKLNSARASTTPEPSALAITTVSSRTACTKPGTPSRERALSSSGSAKSASSRRTSTAARLRPDTVRMKTPSSRTVRSSPSTSRKPR